MRENLLKNPSFEGGWTDLTESIQAPNDWLIWYADGDKPNPHDPNPWAEFVPPEFVHKLRNQLPPAEQDLFILDGDVTLKVFKGTGSWFGGLEQGITLEPGVYKFMVNVYGDLVKAYKDGKKVWANDPEGRDGLLRFVVDGVASEFVSLTPGERNTKAIEFEFLYCGTCYVGIDIMCSFPLDNAGVFLDDWSLVRIGDIPEPPPDPPPIQRGAPREQYERVYVLLPPDADAEWANAVVTATWDWSRYTVGGSADDAGIGDLDDRTAIVVNPNAWGPGEDGQGIYGFFATNYPGVMTKQVVAESPGDLLDLLDDLLEEMDKLQPFEEEPLEPGEPDPKPLNEIVTLHRQTDESGIAAYLNKVRPEWIKTVGGAEDLAKYKEWGAKNGLARFVVHNPGEYIAACNVEGYLSHYEDALETGIVKGYIDAVEDINEQDPSDPKVIDFCIAISNEIAWRYGDDVKLCSGNWAVGNGEPIWLRRWAAVIAENKHLGGYHDYYPCSLEWAEDWMESAAKWYHMRHVYYLDPDFRDCGIYMDWLATEGGPVRADAQQATFGGVGVQSAIPVPVIDPAWIEAKKRLPMLGADDSIESVAFGQAFVNKLMGDDPGGLDPAGGWRHETCLNGDFPRYTRLELRLRKKYRAWNAEHANRMRGTAKFTIAAKYCGWLKFRLEEPEMDALGDALVGR